MSVVYDKAKYHFDWIDWPKDLPIEQAYVHTGMFLGWVIDRDLYDKENMQALGAMDMITKFKNRKLSGPKFFEQQLDGVFTDEDLNVEGNEFAQYYFDFSKGKYLKDYEELFLKDLPSQYYVMDTWENYDTLKKRVDTRYEEWKNRKSWKFWKW